MRLSFKINNKQSIDLKLLIPLTLFYECHNNRIIISMLYDRW
jgi:hypothetical protein